MKKKNSHTCLHEQQNPTLSRCSLSIGTPTTSCKSTRLLQIKSPVCRRVRKQAAGCCQTRNPIKIPAVQQTRPAPRFTLCCPTLLICPPTWFSRSSTLPRFYPASGELGHSVIHNSITSIFTKNEVCFVCRRYLQWQSSYLEMRNSVIWCICELLQLVQLLVSYSRCLARKWTVAVATTVAMHMMCFCVNGSLFYCYYFTLFICFFIKNIVYGLSRNSIQ